MTQEAPIPSQDKSIATSSFGFTAETFNAHVTAYIDELRKNLDDNPLTAEDEKAHYYKRLKQANDSFEAEVAHLRTRMAESPQALFDFVEGIFNRARTLEDEGLDRAEVAGRLLDEHEGELIPLLPLIEHGLAQPWGYRLAQVTMAVRAERRYKNE